jgi:hypothetical protein
MTKEEIKQTGHEAYPVRMASVDGKSFDLNEAARKAFLRGIEFREWLDKTSMSHADVPVFIKYRMFKNQRGYK